MEKKGKGTYINMNRVKVKKKEDIGKGNETG